MLISRASLFKHALTKSGLQATTKNAIKNNILTQSVRKHGTWTYRTAAESVPLYKRVWGQAASGFMWWWVCWHLYWDIGHIVGEFPYPDTSQWTDEELGIPPDDLD